ncbi:hypothetical protein [Trinickia symbiotica]|uniref:Uncharacterized protein n=1 Tax=Trinickia symbiotica TaxID=863227 RepID=A0A2N7XA99_9BURK|nr:hypothetical protein [Trinickia symbiotica]PMS38472.1 hypothetical protein C0Z20_00880 [Trinickia symbiotica]
MKLDKTGLLLVGGAALVLYMVVKKSTAGAPASSGQPAIGAGASSFWSNVINNLGGKPVATTAANVGGLSMPGGVTLFGNGTFDANGMYVDPGQLTYNTTTGQVQESPFSGMYNILSPATYGQ